MQVFSSSNTKYETVFTCSSGITYHFGYLNFAKFYFSDLVKSLSLKKSFVPRINSLGPRKKMRKAL